MFHEPNSLTIIPLETSIRIYRSKVPVTGNIIVKSRPQFLVSLFTFSREPQVKLHPKNKPELLMSTLWWSTDGQFSWSDDELLKLHHLNLSLVLLLLLLLLLLLFDSIMVIFSVGRYQSDSLTSNNGGHLLSVWQLWYAPDSFFSSLLRSVLFFFFSLFVLFFNQYSKCWKQR